MDDCDAAVDKIQDFSIARVFGFILRRAVMDRSHEHLLIVSTGGCEIVVGFKGRTVFPRRALSTLVTTIYEQCVGISKTRRMVISTLCGRVGGNRGEAKAGPFLGFANRFLRITHINLRKDRKSGPLSPRHGSYYLQAGQSFAARIFRRPRRTSSRTITVTPTKVKPSRILLSKGTHL